MSTVAARHRSPPPRTLGLLVITELKLAWRYPVGLIFGLGLPMLLLVIFGSIPSLTHAKAALGGISFFNLYAPTLLILVVLVLGLLSLPVQMAGYREQGVLRRMSTTPVPAYFLLGAQVAVNLALAVLAMAMILGVGAGVFGLTLPGDPGWLVLSIILTIGALFGVGLCLAAVAGTPQVANGLGAALFYPLGFFSGLWVPLTELHVSVINRIAEALPSGAAFNALHASFAGRFPGGEPIGVLLGYAVVLTAAAVRWFRWGVEASSGRRRTVLSLLTRTITVPRAVTAEEVERVLRNELPESDSVLPATRIKGWLFGEEPAGPDVMLVTTGRTGLWRAELRVVRRPGLTVLQVRPGGHPLYSALGVARRVGRVLREDSSLGAVSEQEEAGTPRGGRQRSSSVPFGP
ncbi:MAG: ABC transporter permease [Acidimicrobiales bacterium]|nr:ABC transporter permease [Acidimicrobiales bacterium]